MTSLLLGAISPAPAPAASAAPLQVTQAMLAPAMPHTWFATHAGWLTHSLAVLAIVLALGLVLLLAVQTTKQEGLSGTIGGRVESAYRTRPGMEENMKRFTGFVAVSLVVVWAILSLTGI